MLADDDFGVDTEFAGATENFEDASDGGSAVAGETQNFYVDDGAIEFFQARNALGAGVGIFGIEGGILFIEFFRVRRE